MPSLREYEPIVGRETLNELRLIAKKLKGKVIQNINSAAVGGRVAEILRRIVPLMKELGIDARWDVIKGDDRFFSITKKMHNALHARREEITDDDFDYFRRIDDENANNIDFVGDVVFVHDPQPICLIKKKKPSRQHWAWRCHIDFSAPDERVWEFLHSYIVHYDASVFSAPSFTRELPIPQVLIAPSIDPLSDKNRELPKKTVIEIVSKYGIDVDRPVITQVSRFDYLKDPFGVIDAYRMVKKHIDCQLALVGSPATDDPEGQKVLAQVQEKASGDTDIHIVMLPRGSDIETNAFQAAATVILQKSLKEGFGLTVTEALWKKKPVVASAVGGIPLQIAHKHDGLLSHTVEGTAYWIRQLLNNPEYAKKLGEAGHEHIKNNFLITRHLRDYMLLFLSLEHPDEDIISL